MASRITHLTKSKFNQYCRVLGVPANASESKIKQAFYRKSFEVHPDRNKSEDSESAFAAVSEAYEALIMHLKQGGRIENENKSPVWKGTKQQGHVRKWSQTRSTYNTSASSEWSSGSSADTWQKFSKQGGPTYNEQTSAGDWCEDFYKKQLRDDYHNQRLKKQKSQRDDSKENTGECSVM